MLASPWPLSSDTGSRRRPLFRRVQIALKPASKTLGLHGVFKRGKGRKYLIADSAFKRCKSTTQARTGSMLTSIIWALHFGQAGRSIATNAMTDRRERNTLCHLCVPKP